MRKTHFAPGLFAFPIFAFLLLGAGCAPTIDSVSPAQRAAYEQQAGQVLVQQLRVYESEQ